MTEDRSWDTYTEAERSIRGTLLVLLIVSAVLWLSFVTYFVDQRALRVDSQQFIAGVRVLVQEQEAWQRLNAEAYRSISRAAIDYQSDLVLEQMKPGLGGVHVLGGLRLPDTPENVPLREFVTGVEAETLAQLVAAWLQHVRAYGGEDIRALEVK